MNFERRAVLLAAAAAVLVAAVVVFALSRRPPEVAVVEIVPRETERVLAVVGRVRPLDLVEVRSVNPGEVVRLLRDEGDQVAAGEPMAVVRSVVERAQTEADVARAAAARAEAAQARLAYERTRRLAERGFAAQAALDEARAALRTAEAQVEAAEATARASAARAQEFVVRAPMAGVVLVRPIDSGQVVDPTTTLFELGSLAGVEIRAEVDEAYADTLRPGMAARAALSGAEGRFSARVAEVSPRVDSTTGGRLVKLRPEGGAAPPPGRSVDVTIVVDRRPDVIVIPRQAVVDATASPKAYVVGPDNVVQARPIRVARWPSLNAIVEAGLKPGERVVLDPARTTPSRKVRPVPARSGGA